MKNKHVFTADDEQEMLMLGQSLAKHRINKNDVIYLNGNLGAGKTTLTKGIIHGLGYTGLVKSPTYTLVETYPTNDTLIIQHFDLYRLAEAEELEWIGIRDYFNHPHITLIEWPEKGQDLIPTPTQSINIEYLAKGRRIKLS